MNVSSENGGSGIYFYFLQLLIYKLKLSTKQRLYYIPSAFERND